MTNFTTANDRFWPIAVICRTAKVFAVWKRLGSRPMSKVFEVLKRLEEAKVHYFIGRYRLDTSDITATFVGERVEISVFEDGHVEVSRFVGSEDVLNESVLDEILVGEF